MVFRGGYIIRGWLAKGESTSALFGMAAFFRGGHIP